jgi:hypothetical protein
MSIKPKLKKCKSCDNRFEVWKSTTQVCSIKCALEFARVKAAKKEKQQDRERKSAFWLNDLKTRRPAVKKACHKYIRMRDKDEPCICCNQPLKPDYHAGHFQESGNNPKIRYHEDNIHGQNLNCNYFKGGSGDYEKNLRIKIGDERVDFLLASTGGTVKRTGPELKEIEVYFNDKLKQLELER